MRPKHLSSLLLGGVSLGPRVGPRLEALRWSSRDPDHTGQNAR